MVGRSLALAPELQSPYPVVIITCVHYLGPPVPSTSQILGTSSRFSEDFLGRERGGVPRGSSRTLGDPPGPWGVFIFEIVIYFGR